MNGTTRSRGRGGVAGWAGQHKESIEKETLRARRYSLGPCGVKQIRWGFLFCLFVCFFFACVWVSVRSVCVCVCVAGFFLFVSCTFASSSTSQKSVRKWPFGDDDRRGCAQLVALGLPRKKRQKNKQSTEFSSETRYFPSSY